MASRIPCRWRSSASLAHCGYHVGQIVLIARILAGDHWTTITIPRGASAAFNQRVWGKGHYHGAGAEREVTGRP